MYRFDFFDRPVVMVTTSKFVAAARATKGTVVTKDDLRKVWQYNRSVQKDQGLVWAGNSSHQLAVK